MADLEEIGNLGKYIEQTHCVLFFLSKGYFFSQVRSFGWPKIAPKRDYIASLLCPVRTVAKR